MPKHPNYTAISIHRETAEKIKAFQVLAIAKTGRMMTVSEAIEYALATAAEQLTKE